MRKSTPTLTQSGLLAVLLQRQRYAVIELARRHAHRQDLRAAFWKTLTWPFRALTARTARQLHRAPATDSRRPADPTSRMGRAKWRILHAPHGRARHFDAKRIQRVYRCSSSRPRTGNWKVKTYGIRFKAS